MAYNKSRHLEYNEKWIDEDYMCKDESEENTLTNDNGSAFQDNDGKGLINPIICFQRQNRQI